MYYHDHYDYYYDYYDYYEISAVIFASITKMLVCDVRIHANGRLRLRRRRVVDCRAGVIMSYFAGKCGNAALRVCGARLQMQRSRLAEGAIAMEVWLGRSLCV